jgi:hypothetical protein
VSILAAAAVGLTVALGLTATTVGSLVASRAVAQTAADAAALAAAPVTFAAFGTDRTPSEEAAFFAEANGARLVECSCERDEMWRSRIVVVTVVVDVSWAPPPFDSVAASAAAEFDPTVWLGMGTGVGG